jgi:ATP-dependent exoDNAse (exonuclease V) beta subunit
MKGLNIVYRHLHVMNLMKYLEEKRRELLISSGFFYLGDIPRVLKTVIEQGGAGMVYEKTGNRYDHIFIDEFQDTSKLQWDNFAPLIENSLAQGLRCSVVGDIKQAIYRWRNGDWNILATGLKEQYPQYIIEENLDTNRRSLPVIVDFNNRFFKAATGLLGATPSPEELPDIHYLYDGFIQKPWKKDGNNDGFVEATGVYAEDASEYRDCIATALPSLVNKLWESGCRDIAILLRSNKSISHILDALIASHPVYPVVTEKSFRLETHPAIRFMTAMLKSLAYPDDRTCAVNACWSYYEAIGKYKEPDSEFRFHESSTVSEYFTAKGYATDSFMIINDTYTMTCAIAGAFGISSSSDWQPFLSAFLDAVHQFHSSQPGTVQDFLKWYDAHKDDLQVQLENMSDAVKIMTIHKSKGLQFNTVILPYAGWPFRSGESSHLWFHSDDELLKEIPAVRVPCTQESGETMFAGEYQKEIYKSDVDNLNMLYVAMTRAEKQMYLYFNAARPKEEKDSKKESAKGTVRFTSTSKLIQETLGNIQPATENTVTGIMYRFGKPCRFEVARDKEQKHIRLNKGCYAASPELVISIGRKQEAFSETESKIRHGVLLHYLLEKVKTKDDFEKALSESLRNKEIDLSSAGLLKKTFDKLMTDSRFSEWFSGHYSVYNEHTLLSGNDMYRPDRIMVNNDTAIVADYKTGETEAEKYTPQLRKYINILHECGFKKVAGYIVQLDEARLYEITL